MKQKTGAYIAKLTLILFLITAIVGGLLGAVNAITKDRITELAKQRAEAAMQEVLPADAYEEVASYQDDTGLVKAVYKAGEEGYVIQVQPSGFGGAIDMMVGIKADGTVSGVSIISMSETSGLGANAKKESWREQFVGQSGTLAVSKDGGSIDALTGATVTSRAVTSGVNAALTVAGTLG